MTIVAQRNKTWLEMVLADFIPRPKSVLHRLEASSILLLLGSGPSVSLGDQKAKDPTVNIYTIQDKKEAWETILSHRADD